MAKSKIIDIGPFKFTAAFDRECCRIIQAPKVTDVNDEAPNTEPTVKYTSWLWLSTSRATLAGVSLTVCNLVIGPLLITMSYKGFRDKRVRNKEDSISNA